MTTMIEAPVCSGSHKPRVETIDTLVLHYTELELEPSLKILRHGAVSVHYVVAEDGSIYRLLGEDRVAYHAGLSQWRGRAAVNERSVGIEIVNRDGNQYPYPEVQITALIGLCEEILDRNQAIAAANVVGHSDISPKRKIDPGVFFPWEELAAAGIGLWPPSEKALLSDLPAAMKPMPLPSKAGESEVRTEVAALLERCGYPGPHGYGLRDGKPALFAYGESVRSAVDQVVWVDETDILAAFQRRYRPGKIDGIADGPSMGLLRELARLVA